jgi:CRP/FNR family transcriptional regulator, anaerobic regulatory protein
MDAVPDVTGREQRARVWRGHARPEGCVDDPDDPNANRVIRQGKMDMRPMGGEVEVKFEPIQVSDLRGEYPIEIFGARQRIRHRRSLARSGERIMSCGDTSENVFVLCHGWAFRFLLLPGGGRQILGFLLPGDIFFPASVTDKRFHFSVEALTEIQVGEISRQDLARQIGSSPVLRSRWLRDFARQARSADELIAAIGRGTAEARVAHLLLQLTRRTWRGELAGAHRFPFPPRLRHMADAVGLTPECVCRTLGHLRKRGIISLSDGYLEILSFEELEIVGSPQAGT